MSQQKNAPRKRSSDEAVEGSTSASLPSAPQRYYPSPPQHMAYPGQPGQPGPPQVSYGAYQQARPPHLSSMNPSEAARHQQFQPGAPHRYPGYPVPPGDPRALATAQQVTPDTRQLMSTEFMSPPSSVRRRSPPGSNISSSKRPRRSGTFRVQIFMRNP
jgi:hypothetical protein